MKKWITYSLFILVASLGYSQPTSWVNNSLPLKHTFTFQLDTFRIENGTDSQLHTVQANDAIAVFTDKIYGFAKFTKNGSRPDSLPVIVHFDTNSKTKPLQFHYWNNTRGCQFIVSHDTTIDELKNGAYNKIISTRGKYETISYGSDIVTIRNIILGAQRNTYVNDVTFSTADTNLKINANGEIDLMASKPNTYTITITSSFCLTSNTIDIKLVRGEDTTATKDTLNISNLQYDLLSPTCSRNGQFSIRPQTISGKGPFQFKLMNSITSHVIHDKVGNITEVPEGKYQLIVSDSSGKEAVFAKPVTLSKSEECDNPVLMPDGKSGVQAIFIPETGMAKILDREGNHIKDLTIPGEWDGRDNKGQPVPMGDYYLFVNEKQSKVITVLR